MVLTYHVVKVDSLRESAVYQGFSDMRCLRQWSKARNLTAELLILVRFFWPICCGNSKELKGILVPEGSDVTIKGLPSTSLVTLPYTGLGLEPMKWELGLCSLVPPYGNFEVVQGSSGT